MEDKGLGPQLPIGPGYQLFGPGQSGIFWDIVGDGATAPGYLDALLHLAGMRHALPAPVYFQVPDGMWSNPRWQDLVNVSQPQCRCLARRVLVPETGRARFIPQGAPRTVLVKQTGSPLFILPHGGDLAAAHMSWSFDHNRPTCTEVPMRERRPHQQSISFGHGSSPAYQDGVMRFDYPYLMETIRRRGEVICYRTLSNGADRVAVPVCSITSVRPSESGAINMAIELDASVSYQFVHPDDAPPPHECAA